MNIVLFPGVHVVNADIARKMKVGSALQPQYCKVMNRPLTYLFYGSASYLDYKKEKYILKNLSSDACFPFACVVDIHDLSIEKIFCTDSGFVMGKIKRGELEGDYFGRLEVGNCQEDLSRYISSFWRGNNNYVQTILPDEATLENEEDKFRLNFLKSLAESLEASFTGETVDFDDRVLRTEILANKDIHFRCVSLFLPVHMLGEFKGGNFKEIITYTATAFEDPVKRFGALNESIRRHIGVS